MTNGHHESVTDSGKLNPPRLDGGMSLNQTLASRRSERSYSTRELNFKEVSQLLWAGQGKTSNMGFRTAPSAGGTFPLEIHMLSSNGVFSYLPGSHSVEKLAPDDRRAALGSASLGQSCVTSAAANFVFAGVVGRTSGRYGDRAGLYVALEAGAASQNLLLEATAMNLGSVIIGAFHDAQVKKIAILPVDSIPLAIVSVGEALR